MSIFYISAISEFPYHELNPRFVSHSYKTALIFSNWLLIHFTGVLLSFNNSIPLSHYDIKCHSILFKFKIVFSFHFLIIQTKVVESIISKKLLEFIQITVLLKGCSSLLSQK